MDIDSFFELARIIGVILLIPTTILYLIGRFADNDTAALLAPIIGLIALVGMLLEFYYIILIVIMIMIFAI